MELLGLLLVLGFFGGSVCGIISICAVQRLRRQVLALEKALGEKKALALSVFGGSLPPVLGAGAAVSSVKVAGDVAPVADVLASAASAVACELPPELPESPAEIVAEERAPVQVLEPVAPSVPAVLDEAQEVGECSSVESFIGGKLFAWLGALCLFICLGYFAKYSIDNNLVSPELRVGSIYVFGAALLGFGVYFGRRTKFIILSGVFLSVGLSAFYIATIAAYRFYQLPGYSFEVAGLVLVVITALGLLLAYVVPSRTIACLSLIGGFATPFMLDLVSASGLAFSWYLILYVGILNVGLLLLSGLKRWSFVSLLGIVGSLIIFFSWIMVLGFCCECPSAGRVMVDFDEYLCMVLVFICGISMLYIGFSLWERVVSQIDRFCTLIPLWLLSVAFWLLFVLIQGPLLFGVGMYFFSLYASLICFAVLLLFSLGLAVCVGLRTCWGLILYACSVVFANILTYSVLNVWQGCGESGLYIQPFCVLLVFVFFALGLFLSLRREQVGSAVESALPWYLYVSVLGGLIMLACLISLGGLSSLAEGGFSLMVGGLGLKVLSILGVVCLAFWACSRWRFPYLGACIALGLGIVSLLLPYSASILLSAEAGSCASLYWLWLLLLELSILLVVLAPFFCKKSSEGSMGLWISSALICPMSFCIFQNQHGIYGWDIDISVLFLLVSLPSLLSIAYLWWKERMSVSTISAYAGVSILCVLIFSLLQFEGLELALALMLEAFVLMWVLRSFGHKAFAVVVVCLSVAGTLCVLNASLVPVLDLWAIPAFNVYLWQLGLPSLLLLSAYWIMPTFPRVVNLLLVLGGTLIFYLVNLEIANFFTPEGSPRVLWEASSFAHALAYSCAWGLFALCLLTLGFIRKNRVLRWVGLALFSITLFKVLCFDTAYLRELYRVISLFVTAALVIGASVFYQKWISSSKVKQTDQK